MLYQEKIENELLTQLTTLLGQDLQTKERQALQQAADNLQAQVDFYQVVHQLKLTLSPLAVANQLSPQVLAFFTELSRSYTNTGAGSPWNALVKSFAKSQSLD